MRQAPLLQRHRFDRKGNVVPDRRRLASYFGTDDYRPGMPIFAVKHSSLARRQYKASRSARRAAARLAR